MRRESKYLENLDGLRALAIAGVLVFHVSESHLPGGFVGVDVFFVISGFIITRGIRARGEAFRFADFYARRMARLLPAAMVTIAVTLLASAALLAPGDQQYVATTALAALAFASNVFFTFNAGYFDDALASNPLLHFWSLSVEEQFYLVWPLLILGLARLGPSRAARAIAALTLGAILLSWAVERRDPVVFFYAMPLRAFQFLLGACLVYLERRPASRALHEGVFVSGLALVGVAFVAANGDDYSFVVAALLPAVGAMCMIHSIESRGADLLLGTSPMRALGRSAYSIYLVHWPLIVFYRLTFGAVDSPGEVIGIVAASLAGGWALRFGVESPLRLSRDDPHRRRKLGSVAALVAGTTALAGALWSAPARFGTDHRGDRPEAPGASSPSDRAAWDLRALERERKRSRALAERCQLFVGAPLSSLDLDHCLEGEILLVGDSWLPGTLEALDTAVDGARIAMLGGAGCGHVVPAAASGRPASCRALVSLRSRAMRDARYQAIVVAVNWSAWPEQDLRPAFDALRATGKKIVIFSDRPFFEAKVPTLLGMRTRGASASGLDLTPYLDPDAERAAMALRWTLADYSDFAFVDQRRVLCPDACPAFTPEGELLYLDRGHLSVAGARWLGDSLREELTRILE